MDFKSWRGELRRQGLRAYLKLGVGALALLLLVGLAMRELLGCRVGNDQSCVILTKKWSDLAFASATVTAIALTLIGWTFIASRKALKNARINDSATSIALAGLVDPLLRLELAMRSVAALSIAGAADPKTPSAVLEPGLRAMSDETRDFFTAARTGGVGSRLKWCQPILEGRDHASKADPAGGRFREPTEIVTECIHATVAKVRDWSDLLVLSDAGMDALYCLQSLRVDLQDLELYLDNLESKATPTNGDWNNIQARADVLRSRILLMACSFEYASFPKQARKQVTKALEFWRTELSEGSKPSSGEPRKCLCAIADAKDESPVNHCPTICQRISKLAEDVHDEQSKARGDLSRGSLRTQAWKDISHIQEVQLELVQKAERGTA